MNDFMSVAIQEAVIGITNGHGGPFGAVIVKDGKIISKGHNHVVANNDPTCHGEIDAIRKACKELGTFDLTGCEIYTTGEPCPMCLGAILWANISKIYYACNLKDNESIGFRDDIFYKRLAEYQTHKDDSFVKCIDRDAGLKLFAEYNKITDKVNY